jgi:hypothetical protein
MIVDDFVGSTFLKAADLGTQTPTITVSKVEPVEFQDGSKKLVLHPAEATINPIVLNMTNSRACVAAWGNDSDNWINKQAMLSVRQTQMGPGLGVTPINAPGQPANPNQVNTGNADVPFDDKIPY